MLYVPGAGQTLNEQLGLSNKADRISGVNNNNLSYTREQDSPFRRLEIITNLQRPPSVKFGDLQSLAGSNSGIVEDEQLAFNMRVDFFRQSDEKVITTFTVQTDNKNVTFNSEGGIETAKLNIFGRITSVAGKRTGIFENAVTTNATTEELAEAKLRKLAYQKAYALAPGTYRVDVVVRDVVSGKTGTIHQGFTVPKYDPTKLSTSTLILASKLANLNDNEVGSQFSIGDKKVIPNVSGVYKKGQEVGIYMQIYNAQIDQTTLRPAVDVEYVLSKDGKEIFKQKEDWRGMSDAGQRLTLARLLPTSQLPTGDYELKINITDRVATKDQNLTPTAKFTLTQ